MGSGGSKDNAKGKALLINSSSFCLCLPSGSRRPPPTSVPPQDFEHFGEENGDCLPCRDQTDLDESQVKVEFCRKSAPDISTEGPHVASENGIRESTSDSLTAGSSSSRASTTQSLHPVGGFLCRFSFVPGNVSCRLSRATSLGSSSDPQVSHANIVVNGEDFDSNEATPRDIITLPESQGYLQPAFLYRRAGRQAPVERNVRYSRNLSVGRLRDRVFRRSSLSESAYCTLLQGTDSRDNNENSERQVPSNDARDPSSTINAASSALTSGQSPSSMAQALYNTRDSDRDGSRSREARYRNLLEQRSDFLERRRRIRSQVRALQRLGSRFENLSGHERSCILTGQHRTGQCTCQSGNRHSNSNEDNNARASISRIVMLAEALFEVLDEIHQQSVVLSSRQSVSSIGSVPAPIEVVESLPVKLYTKLQKHQNDETAHLDSHRICALIWWKPPFFSDVHSDAYPKMLQCLLEYEDGDSMRILPCDHFFHCNCVDRWLKEIHRICPLCRGDICKTDLFSSRHWDC